MSQGSGYDVAMEWYREKGIEPSADDLSALEQIRLEDLKGRETHWKERLRILDLPKRLNRFIPDISNIKPFSCEKIEGAVLIFSDTRSGIDSIEKSGVQLAAQICLHCAGTVFWTYAQAVKSEYSKNPAFIDREFRDKLQADFLFLHTYEEADLDFPGLRYFLQYRYDAMKTTIFVSPSYNPKKRISEISSLSKVYVRGAYVD